jgi:PKD repeat protein
MFSKHAVVRVGIGLSIIASLFSSFSPTAQAQTTLDELTPTATVTEAVTEFPTETPTSETTEVPDSGEVIAIPTINPDSVALATETPAPEDDAPPFVASQSFEAQSFAAQSAPAFNPKTIAAEAGIQDVPNVAYNATADNYLTVWSEADLPYRVRGRLMAADGTPQGAAFTIATSSARPSTNRLAYNSADNTYVVLWAEPNGLTSVESYCSGNCVTYTLARYNLYLARLNADGMLITPSPLLITNEVTYYNFFAGFYEVTYNPTANEYLLAWMQPRGAIVGGVSLPHRLVVRRYGPEGTPRSAATPLVIGTASSLSLTYNPTNSEYLVVYDRYTVANGYDLSVRRIDATNFALKGSVLTLTNAGGWQYLSATARDTINNRYLVTWSDERNVQARQVRGRLISGAGVLLGSEIVVAAPSPNPYGLQPAVAYSPIENRYLVMLTARQYNPPMQGHYVSPDGQLVEDPLIFENLAGWLSVAARTTTPNATDPHWLTVWEGNGDIYGQELPPAVPPVPSVLLSITDSAGNPVDRLTIYQNNNDPKTEGWPMYNLDYQDSGGKNVLASPLTVTMLVANALPVARIARLQLSDPNNQFRFYVYDEPTGCTPIVELHSDQSAYSYKSYQSDCDLLAGAANIFEWKVWVQPSIETSLNFSGTLIEPKVDANNNPVEVILGVAPAKSVVVQQAAIYPIIFIPGLGGTNPPSYALDYHDTKKTDDLLWLGNLSAGYDKLYMALEKLGYERNRTYFLFPYDWLLNAVFSAERLRDDLLIPASAEIATTVPWVAGYGSLNGRDVKFDLMGHSTGNLVARAYMQADSDSEGRSMWQGHVRRYVSLAGPHKGLPRGWALFEGVNNESTSSDVCLTGGPTSDIACLAFYYAAFRAIHAKYGYVECKPLGYGPAACLLNWPMESRYLYIHDPFADHRQLGSVTGFLPTYNEIAYLVDSSGDFPYGRISNPLLEDQSILTYDLSGNCEICDPFIDNLYAMANLRERYPDLINDFQTPYYGLNSSEKQTLLFQRIGDSVTNSNNVCLIYAGGGEPDPVTLARKDEIHDTRIQISVSEPQTNPPYWLTGSRPNSDADRFGRGDGFVPGVSGGATDIWQGTLLGNYDLDLELQGNNSGSPANWAAHGALVGYGLTHQHIAQCLIGTAPAFLQQTSSGENPPPPAKVSLGVLAAPVRTQINTTSQFNSNLLISVHGSVELTLSNAAGQRLGYNSNDLTGWQEIPNGLYTTDPDLDVKYLLVWSPQIADYTLTVTSTGSGDYQLMGQYADATAQVSLFYDETATTLGSSSMFTFSVPQNANEVPQPPDVFAGQDMSADEGAVVTFAGRVTDLNPNETLTYRWNFGDGSPILVGSLSPTHIYGDNGNYVVTLTVVDSVGFEVEDTLKVTIHNLLPQVDAGPNLMGYLGQPFIFNGSFSDAGYLDTQTIVWEFGDGTTATGTLTPTHTYSSVGTYSVKLTVRDDDGGLGQDKLVATVQYPFSGFFAPVDNLPILNTVKAGQAIPIKFSLGGNYDLNIIATDYPASSIVTCGNVAEDAIEETVTSGNSGLSYSASNKQYTYVWKTEKAWANTCRTLVIKLSDGTIHKANFKFK